MTRGRWLAMAAAISLIILDLAGAHARSETWWHAMPAFDLLYGVAGCVAIVLVSKFLGSTLLQRRENYYERDL